MSISVYRISMFGCLLAGLLLALPAAAQQYPSSAEMRAGRGHSYQAPAFDLQPGQTQTIVSINEAETYAVCLVGKNATVIADGKNFPLDHRDCIEVTASEIKVQSDDQPGETEGTFYRSRGRGPGMRP